jgi:HKD family nuclease
MTNILTNISSKDNLRKQLQILSKKADRIDIAVAFFTDSDLLKQWAAEDKNINLIFSFRPPTSYFALRDLQSAMKVNISFLGNEFHSKFIIFYKQGKPYAAVLGSSNYTSGGLVENTETNVLLTDDKILSNLKSHFNELLEDSHSLEPTDLDNYAPIYKNWLSRQQKENNELAKFKTSTTKNRTKGKLKASITKEARQYRDYWRTVDEVKELIKEISDKHYPNIPYYLVLDSFWHWIKVTWHKETGITLDRNNQRTQIPKLFREFVKNDISKQLSYKKRISKQIFESYLSQRNVEKLTKSKAKELFQNLHSTGNNIQRFGADELFVEENSIQKIRAALKYLLHSGDEMDLRIHNLMKNPKYKLSNLGPSGVQEINGWTYPEKYPIRNNKADDALKILGYNLT